MNTAVHNKLVSFIWSIADDCLRDVYVRGKYRDVILPMVVLRRLDALLEPTKEAVLEELTFQRDEAQFTEWDENGLIDASGYVFYNTSAWTLQRLHDTATNSQQILQANFEDYLNGFSANVKEIVDKFKLRSQVRHMASKDVLLNVLEKFTSPYINLTSSPKTDPDGRKLAPLTNLGMGYVFEELIRKFNEENNEEAGEHFTPREVIDLMTHIVFEPVKDKLPPVMTIYDPACGSGGMLTESQNFIKDEEGEIRAKGDVYLYGKEINDETYAICKSDMMIKGNNPENIRVGSTLSTDEFAGTTFDFMLSNPPYGKSWASEQNIFREKVEVCCKDKACLVSQPTNSEKKAIFNTVSWYDATAEKVIKGTTKLAGEKLERLLDHLGCNVNQLADYGYFATKKKGEFLEYETESDLRDTENVPLKESIYEYFLREVKPHVSEAWINLDATKIGYEISFNKYFYRHQPLRSIEDVSADILALENESDGLIREILKLG